MNPKVIKRNGSIENFDRGKIIRVVQAAGLETGRAEILAAQIEKWSQSLNIQKIHSLTIRDKVLEELKKIDSYAADLFNQYQKSKEQTEYS